MRRTTVLAFVMVAAFSAAPFIDLQAASHRGAPLIALDPAADLTDVYAFVRYDRANLERAIADRRVTFVMNVDPGQNPTDGPNYFNFFDDALYQFHIDNNSDGKSEDIVYEFEFKAEARPVGRPGGLTSPVPYSDSRNAIRVFAGQRAETSYIHLGPVFDTLNLRRSPPLLSAGEDGDNVNPFGVNRFAGANISTIAIEVPIRRVTFDKQGPNTANQFIGLYASTSRQKVTVHVAGLFV